VRGWFGLTSLLVILGCAEGGGPVATTTRDSAGVTIVESEAPRWQQGDEWTVDSTPLLDLGAGDGGQAFEFDIVAGTLRLDDGSVVVADYQSREIRRFAPDGSLRWVSGREGDGPGEYNRIRHIARYRGDSLLVFDFWIGRATVLDAGGRVGRTFRLGVTGRSDRLLPLNDSTLVGVLFSIQALVQGEGMVRMPEPIVRVRPDGMVVDTIAVVPGGESFMVPEAEILPLFGRRRAQVAVAGGAVYLGTADGMTYAVHAEDGRLQRLVRAPGFDLSLTGEQVEAERNAMLTPESPPWFRDGVAALPTPASRPGYSQLLVDATGAVWLGPYRARSEPEAPNRWQVFAADGEWLGAVSLPHRMRVHDIGADYILGVHPDADDVEHIQLLRLRRR
jgi:outer membrane protein assembly factor BamB